MSIGAELRQYIVLTHNSKKCWIFDGRIEPLTFLWVRHCGGLMDSNVVSSSRVSRQDGERYIDRHELILMEW